MPSNPAFNNSIPSLIKSCNNSIPSLIKSCRKIIHLHQVHAHIIRKGLEQDHLIISHLLSLSTSVSYSTSIFNRLLKPSTILYNILLKTFSKNSLFNDTFLLFNRMRRSEYAFPDKYTYPPLINACSNELKLKEGEPAHGLAIRCGVSDDVYVGSSLIDFYGKCKEILRARALFEEMTQRNVVSWTAMVVGYVNVGDLENAKRIFERMPERNLASWNAMISGLVKAGDLIGARKVFNGMVDRDVVSFTIMIDGYAKTGDMSSARALFEVAPEKDIVAWSALISGYSQNGQPSEAIDIFLKMESMNIKPDEFIMVSLMSACSQVGGLDFAKWVDSYLSRMSVHIYQAHVLVALIDMNAKCGNIERAKQLFEDMPRRDLMSFCSLIQGLSIHGLGVEAVELFNRMLNEGLVPDGVAFTVILMACSRGGLIEEGLNFFETMKNKYSIVPSPDHYACIVDLLSRAGQLKAAYDLLKSMLVEPHACAWGALLGACKQHGDVELGKVVADQLFKVAPQNAGTYVLLSDIYASANQWLDVSFVRDKMKERGISKIPGWSCIYTEA